MLRAASLPSSDHVVFVVSSSQPVVGGNVVALFPDKTWERAVTGKNSEAKFDLHALHLSTTVFVAAEGFAAGVERGWVPAERALHVELRPLPGGGAVVFPLGTGFIPGLAGRLNPKLARLNRTCVRADNVSINDGEQQPVPFAIGEELRLTDADGIEKLVGVVETVSRSALLEYKPYQGKQG